MSTHNDAILSAVATLAGGAGAGALIRHWFTRRHQDAEIERITAQAHSEIYKAYGGLLDDLRADALSARAEATAARKAAWAAEARASGAEAMVAEIRTLIQKHPNAEELLNQIEALQKTRKFRDNDR